MRKNVIRVPSKSSTAGKDPVWVLSIVLHPLAISYLHRIGYLLVLAPTQLLKCRQDCEIQSLPQAQQFDFATVLSLAAKRATIVGKLKRDAAGECQ